MATLCPRHPGIPTTDLCVGCGEFVCGQCAYVASDRRVFCPSCKERLSAEELAGLTSSAEASPGSRLPKPQPVQAGRAPAEPLAPLAILPAAEVQSPVWLALKSSPIAFVVALLGLVGFGCWPVAMGGMALGLNELRLHFGGDSHRDTRLVVGSFAVNVVAVLWHMGTWTGR